MKVLIVDDEADICFLLSGILMKKNYHTSYVNTLKGARSVLNNESPNILFLDNHLPDGLGVDFIRYVKEHNPATKIIMITADDAQSDKSKAIEQGIDMFIGKPFTRQTIYNALEAINNKPVKC